MKKGFSAIEIIIVVAIMAVIAVIGTNTFKTSSIKKNLDSDVDQAASLVEEARNNALASLDNSEYGVRFASTSVTLFKGKIYSSSPSNKTHSFSNGIYAEPISIVGGGDDIYFNRLTGEPSATGTVTFKTSADLSLSKIMSIGGTGIVQIN